MPHDEAKTSDRCEKSSPPLLTVAQLTCERDDRRLFAPFDWMAHGGELWQLTGANGAGKTSLLGILAGVTGGYEGRVAWCLGADDAREQLGFVGHRPGLRAELTAEENLLWLTALHDECTNVTRTACLKTVRDALARLGLTGFADVPLAQLSAGQQRRVGLARLWLSSKRVWLLDEPFTAVDARGVALLAARLEALTAAGGLVIYTSHHAVNASARRIELADGHARVLT